MEECRGKVIFGLVVSQWAGWFHAEGHSAKYYVPIISQTTALAARPSPPARPSHPLAQSPLTTTRTIYHQHDRLTRVFSPTKKGGTTSWCGRTSTSSPSSSTRARSPTSTDCSEEDQKAFRTCATSRSARRGCLKTPPIGGGGGGGGGAGEGALGGAEEALRGRKRIRQTGELGRLLPFGWLFGVVT